MSDVVPGTRCSSRKNTAAQPACQSAPPQRGHGPEASGVVVRPPRLPTRSVDRPELLRRLDRMAPLTILDALPGLGKTTLAASWARGQHARGVSVQWVQASLGHDVTAALDGPLAEGEAPVVVVVDDAHRLGDRSVVERLVGAVELDHRLHLVVCCQPGHLFHEVAEERGVETNVLRGADLAVPVDRIPELAASWGHDVDTAVAGRLHRLVGGWPLALRLVLDATPPGKEELATHAAHDFLEHRVLPVVADATALPTAARFAVPDELDLPLAAALMPDGDPSPEGSRAAVAALERLGVLWRTPRDDGEPQWRFPVLVRNGLRRLLECTAPETHADAHREVARVLTASDDRPWRQVVRHARAAGDWRRLAEAWTEDGWMLLGGDPALFHEAYGGLPAAAVADHPTLGIAAAMGDALAATREGAPWQQLVEDLLRHYAEIGAGTPVASEARGLLRVEQLTAAMVARRAAGHLVGAVELAVEVEVELGRLRGSDPRSARTSQAAWARLQGALTHLLAGDFTTALDLAAAAHHAGGRRLTGSGAAGLLAAMHAISGQSAQARRWLDAHDDIDVADCWAADLARVPARIARAMLALDRLDTAAAAAQLAEVPLETDASGLWPLAVMAHTRHALLVDAPATMLSRLHDVGRATARQLAEERSVPRQAFDRCRVDLTMAVGDADRTATLLGADTDPPPWLLAPAARFRLAAGDAAAAVRIASVATWAPELHTRDRLELLVTQASALHAGGDEAAAVDSFRKAAAIGRESGNLEPLLLLDPDVRRRLLVASGEHLEDEEVRRLDAARPVYPRRVELVRLSPREREVLRRLPRHDTVASLARELSVSVNTVKKQLRSVYAKLGVSNRSAALQTARQLGLLEEVPAQQR
ncbi:LuxR C-terminal-related transcriptional regulator [Nocardioides sp. TF02-7]|uniref:helix-turn-helix transcriptional regulator n=1 Tax=Nocardioides sp. TF02-7 TaxID=2917724 RepID=UPI001F06AC9D|nr:LuxR C-terminal-related transcriptional regulator [Nocardioides sp. TF02-7]UMG93677.1 LuxR C-terminal-related transcriptional regulator [Nocardioides sp. TF02-7]